MIPRHLQIAGAMVLLALIAAGVYGVQLKRRDERNQQRAMSAAPLASTGGEQTRFAALLAFDDDGVLAERTLAAPLPEETSERIRAMLRSVLHAYAQQPSPHSVPPGSDVRAVYVTREGLCVIDVNATLAEGHRSGLLIEQFTALSLMGTVALNFDFIKEIKIVVEGQERVSLAGHAQLAMAYDAATVRAAVKEYTRR